MYYSQFHESFQTLLRELKTLQRRVVVIGHARPDGDCIGSQIALARLLRALGCEACCVNGDPLPRRQRFVQGDTPFFLRSEFSVKEGDVALYVDCGDGERAGRILWGSYPNPLGNIDHHLNNPNYARYNIVDTTSAATCEILAGLMLDLELPIDVYTAKALYLGIATDTGQFRFNATSQRTFNIAAELLTRGANAAETSNNLYNCESIGKLQLLQRFLASFTMECEGRVCIGFLPSGIFKETHTTAEDIEGIVDYTRSIEGVEIGVLLEERPDGVKASLRSKDPAYRVDLIAEQFNGGGHACAAGLNCKGAKLATFYPDLVAAIGKSLQRMAKAG